MPSVREAPSASDASTVIATALRGAETTGGLRAFAVSGITCVVSWRPAGLTGSHEVRFALRTGMTRREHAAVIPDLSLLARTCEHHVREFARAHSERLWKQVVVARDAADVSPNAGRTEILIVSPWGLGVLELTAGGSLAVPMMAANGTRFGGWLLNTADNRFDMVGDFNGDGRVEILVTSPWGIGMLRLAGSALTQVMIAPNGTRFGGWLLNTADNRIGIGMEVLRVHVKILTTPSISIEQMLVSMQQVYEALVYWADVIVVATPIRWGNASSLFYKMAERMNCIQNQITINDRVLIRNKVATFIITGGQDNIQAVAGQLLTFFSEIGFHFPQFPFIAHSRGWDAEDMERNVTTVEQSESLRDGARQLVTRGAALARLLLGQGAGVESTPRGGRKASPLLMVDRDPPSRVVARSAQERNGFRLDKETV